MKNAIIVHGTTDKEEYYSDYPSGSNAHWVPWLSKQLIKRDIYTHAPEMPDAWMPDYKKWVREFERYDVGFQTTLVGHSCGGGFLVRWLSEHPNIKVKQVVLVAPWMDPDKTKGEDNDFFDFDLNPKVVDQASSFVMLHSTDNMVDVSKTVSFLRSHLADHTYREFEGYGYFCYGDLEGEEFPELLEIILDNAYNH